MNFSRNAINPLLESFGIIEPQSGGRSDGRIESVESVEDFIEDKTKKSGQTIKRSATAGADEITWPFKSIDEESESDQFDKLDKTVADTTIHGQQETNLPGWKDSLLRNNGEVTQPELRAPGMKAVQSGLATQVLETITSNEEFGVLLEVVLAELRQVDDRNGIEDLRWTLIREVDKLLNAHNQLAKQLDMTHHYLGQVESDSRQLSDELSRARMLSMTDELTGLPNRRAFLQRIEDEVARVQRYGFPLSFALIDLDFFKQINDKYGHAGGDEVLDLYSKKILSIFRHHDLVARYGGEEFAVLLPNTDAEGSMRALNKVRNRADQMHWKSNGETIKVPTFSAGVSVYKPGETASTFIERADKALYRAKSLGRNRVELDTTYSEDS